MTPQISVSSRIAQLEDLIKASHDRWWAEALARRGPNSTPKDSRNLGLWAREQHTAECVEWNLELEALRAPFVGLCVFQGKVLVATAAGLFKLQDGKLAAIPRQWASADEKENPPNFVVVSRFAARLSRPTREFTGVSG